MDRNTIEQNPMDSVNMIDLSREFTKFVERMRCTRSSEVDFAVSRMETPKAERRIYQSFSKKERIISMFEKGQ